MAQEEVSDPSIDWSITAVARFESLLPVRCSRRFCTGRIGEDRRLEIMRRDVVADGAGEQIDDLVCLRSDKVGAKDAQATVFDENLEGVSGLADMTRRVPIGRVLMTGAELETCW